MLLMRADNHHLLRTDVKVVVRRLRLLYANSLSPRGLARGSDGREVTSSRVATIVKSQVLAMTYALNVGGCDELASAPEAIPLLVLASLALSFALGVRDEVAVRQRQVN